MSGPDTRLALALADRYRIERELGQGGMATVYLAEDVKQSRKVALKVLKPELAAVLGAVKRSRALAPRSGSACGTSQHVSGDPVLENPLAEGDNAISPERTTTCVPRTSLIPGTITRSSTASGRVRHTPTFRNTSG
jgi:serine/threonine protein kinase